MVVWLRSMKSTNIILLKVRSQTRVSPLELIPPHRTRREGLVLLLLGLSASAVGQLTKSCISVPCPILYPRP